MSRRTEARRCTPPANPKRANSGTIPPPARIRRFQELYLLWFFARCALAYLWACEIDPMATVVRAFDVGGPMMPRGKRLRLAQQFEAALVDPEPTRPEAAILDAGTRWFCSLELPQDEVELWSGPPLSRRIRVEPIPVRLAYPTHGEGQWPKA